VHGGLREEQEEEEEEEVKEVAAEVAEAQAKESLNYKTTNAGDRPKNVRRRRDFSLRLSFSLSRHFYFTSILGVRDPLLDKRLKRAFLWKFRRYSRVEACESERRST